MSQKREFFARLGKNQSYNPVFAYAAGRVPQLPREFAKPCFLLLPLAKRILECVVGKWGSVESFRASGLRHGTPILQGE